MSRSSSPGAAGGAPVVAVGSGVALAVALPAALVAQVADAVAGGDAGAPAAVTYPLAVLVLLAAALGGAVVGQRLAGGERWRRAAVLGGLSGAVAVAVVQALGVARRLAGADDVAWGTIPVVLVVAAALGASAAALAARRAGRTRP